MSGPDPVILPDLTGKTLLIVDDNDDHLELLQLFLKACNAHVLMARNVDAALAYFGNRRVDMLISDLAMPGKDGISLVHAVRARPGPERTVFAIALTGFSENYPNARLEGFDAFLQKPIDVEKLARTLRSFF